MEKFKEFLIKTKEVLVNNWKVMLICLAVLLLMGQCSSCSRDNRVEKRDAEITVLNSKVDSLVNEYNHLKTRFDDAQLHNSDFTNIATGNQNDLNRTITDLRNENSSLRKQVSALTNTCEALRKDNVRLNKEIVDLMEKLNNTK